MEPISSETKNSPAIQKDMVSLPEHLRQWCLSGKSVEETAHLAKNLIQIVSGSAEMIQLGMKHKQFDRVLRSWKIFEPNLRRLQKYILDLIKYTRHYSIQKTECDLNQLVVNAIRQCEHLLKKHSVTLKVVEDKHVRPMLLDPDRIQEMISNLITHALDNLPDHNGTVQISTHYLKDHHQIQLSVYDDGPALNETSIRSLSEPHEWTQNMCGTGFDIPLAGMYIEQHDGYMEFESTPDKGNCVHVYLPIS